MNRKYLLLLLLLASPAVAQNPPSAVTRPPRPHPVTTLPGLPCSPRDFVQAADTGATSICKKDGSGWTTIPAAGAGAGDVSGPGSAIDNHLAVFNGVTGKLIKDGGAIPSATPAGSNTQVQFNDSGVFAGDAGLVYNKTTDALTIVGSMTAASVTTTGAAGVSGFINALEGTVPTGSDGPAAGHGVVYWDSTLHRLEQSNNNGAFDPVLGRATTDILTNKTFDTAGAGNSFSINGLAATANTGTGAVVRAASPAITTPTGIVKGDVGLGNVDNTSDVNKPVSTAQATADALNLKISLNLSDLNNAGTARTNLGGTTVGANLFTATNPSAISFPKVAADNSVSFRTPAQVLSDIGAQAGPLTGDGTTSGAALTLKNTGSAGTYRSTTFDAQGRETSGTNPTTFSGYALSDTSANLRAALTDENGSGVALFDSSTSATFITPILGTPTSVTLTNATGLPTTGLTGTLQAAQEPAHTGDVTNSGGSLALTIAANAVTLAKLATQATNTVLGNATSGTAVPSALAVGTCSTASSALIWTTNTGFGCNTSITAASVTGFTAGAGTLTGPASAGVAETLGNNETITGIKTFGPTLRSSGVAAYFTINIPADTSQTASTEAAGFKTVTATRTWATTGTVALQRENFFAGPTYASASASQTFTDAFTLYATPPVAGSNAIFTRGHTLGIVDSTSAASSTTGGLIVATTLGTAASSCGIGGGNINCGGSITSGGNILNNIDGTNSIGQPSSNRYIISAYGIEVGTSNPPVTGQIKTGGVTLGVDTTSAAYKTVTNCADSAGAAACGSAAAGSFVIDAATTSTVVSTTAVTANSQILVQYDSSLGTRLSVTCNTTPALPSVTARTAGTSFTVTVPAGPITNPACYNYTIIN